jgi:2-polyprenyl-6-methoxyphenol hydroxylase-like FAD-dependent oxidoreductase
MNQMAAEWTRGKRVAIAGAGPGGVSTALAMLKQGYDVRLFERQPEPKALGGAVLLSVPVLAVLRHYGIDVRNFGSYTRTQFRNNKGHVRSHLPFNPTVEKAMGIPGWHYGVLRASAFAKMLEKLPEGILVPNHAIKEYEERGDEVIVRFENGEEIAADMLVGADGIHSRVSRQAFGDSGLFHVGLRLWLAWCEDFGGIDREIGAIHHSRHIQASFFPMLHDDKPGFEWWIVEPVKEGDPPPPNPEAHIRKLLGDFVDPMPRFPDHTDFGTQVFRWEIYNRPSLQQWTSGRVACVGDAVHPVSPYAAYGMGMAIEDGYFLARELGGRDLGDLSKVTEAFRSFENVRVNYVNHHVEFARKLGGWFHHAPRPIGWIRDKIFDSTTILHRMIQRDYLADAETLSLQLKELHVVDQREAQIVGSM